MKSLSQLQAIAKAEDTADCGLIAVYFQGVRDGMEKYKQGLTDDATDTLTAYESRLSDTSEHMSKT